MQYHQDGFRPGDPAVAPEDKRHEQPQDAVDVLIVGCGPAGLTLAAQLAAFPQISTRITDRKQGPLEVGQADGVACRSVEMFAAFGFADKVIKEAYHVNEVTFWRQGEQDGTLTRADRIRDVEEDLSEMPHVILSQARLHDFYLEVMRSAPTRLEPDYGFDLIDAVRTDDPDYPVSARFQTPQGEVTIKAKYTVGCDGARSTVRQSMGLDLKGQAARQLWGVMDVLAVTDFPDIRRKVAVQSKDQGSTLIIPREGGFMVRMYIELDALNKGERAADRNVTADQLVAKAQAILAPYTLGVKEVAWWSAYEIGQRLCDTFDDATEGQDPRMFIAGDACHTHSPKAGQGMNVSMADTFNLGWKLAAVLRGQAPTSLLATYSNERRAMAKELIDFDRDMARLFSAKPRDAQEAAQFQSYFKKHGRYTAGVATSYGPSVITGTGQHQALASGLKVGMRFHSAPVIRQADAKALQLGHVLKADGRWRLIAFADAHDSGAGGQIAQLCDYLQNDPASPTRRYTPRGADTDSVIDLRAVFQQPHHALEITDMPAPLRPGVGRFGLTDYEKVFCPDPAPNRDIFDMRGIARDTGALVLVRPDQHVAQVLALGDHKALRQFLDQVMLPPEDCG